MTFDLRTHDKAAEVAEAEPVAYRYRYIYESGKASKWVYTQAKWESAPASKFYAAVEAEPLYGQAALAAIRALPAAQGGWMPIETAPRTHFPILTWSLAGGSAVAFLDITWTWWPCPATKKLKHQPTHWQPLPPPPSQEGDAG